MADFNEMCIRDRRWRVRKAKELFFTFYFLRRSRMKESNLKNYEILIVDDEIEYQKVVSMILEDAGFMLSLIHI